MKIITVKIKANGKCVVEFSNKKKLVLWVDDVINLKIKKNQEIDEKFYKKIVYTSLLYLLKDYGLRQVAMSPKSFPGLKKKLIQNLKKREILLPNKIWDQDDKWKLGKEDFEKIIEEVLEDFRKNKLIDDIEYVRFYIKKSGNKSFRQISYELRREGVGKEVIKEKINKWVRLNTGLEEEKIRKIIFKKIKDKSDLLDFKKKNKIISALYRKGFAIDQVKRVIDESIKK
ncbi:RecX family transcriptional regulator [Patescibacteria group bacterium]|nr:RecX family transcriptional regulator [Patescibacteria group bacterium]MCG2702398.1 RecX family transcriptional regulator [Candidatus Parcubacteria bacterium]MBU4264831.1 RecX family transcriptional regulator [Patescibacteria group bacterium]MBU4389702.1 RecX family transcriptional regulator [Patescibacteria group bacterium]MBU4397397.1 RecX family transcriptional regulator [Patescibacteria group bacterium]